MKKIFQRTQAWTSQAWVDYFNRQAHRRLQISHAGEPPLSREEMALIYPSMAAFQRGEGSEGEVLIAKAQAFATRQQDPAFLEAIRLFIQEEQAHSAYVAQFMASQGLALRKRSLLDALFRRIRQLGGICMEVMTLMTAEIIALSYYPALKAATSSPMLKEICDQMIVDEIPHIPFQTRTLSAYPSSLGWRVGRRVFIFGACLAVGLAFRPLFQAGGMSLARILKRSLKVLDISMDRSGERTRGSGPSRFRRRCFHGVNIRRS